MKKRQPIHLLKNTINEHPRYPARRLRPVPLQRHQAQPHSKTVRARYGYGCHFQMDGGAFRMWRLRVGHRSVSKGTRRAPPLTMTPFQTRTGILTHLPPTVTYTNWKPCRQMRASGSTNARTPILCSNLNRAIAACIAPMAACHVRQYRRVARAVAFSHLQSVVERGRAADSARSVFPHGCRHRSR